MKWKISNLQSSDLLDFCPQFLVDENENLYLPTLWNAVQSHVSATQSLISTTIYSVTLRATAAENSQIDVAVNVYTKIFRKKYLLAVLGCFVTHWPFHFCLGSSAWFVHAMRQEAAASPARERVAARGVETHGWRGPGWDEPGSQEEARGEPQGLRAEGGWTYQQVCTNTHSSFRLFVLAMNISTFRFWPAWLYYQYGFL